MFRKFRGVRLPYKMQGLIYFVCQNYHSQPERVRRRIRELCREIGGEAYGRALFELVTGPKGARQIARERAVSESQLYRLRRDFYEAAAENVKDC